MGQATVQLFEPEMLEQYSEQRQADKENTYHYYYVGQHVLPYGRAPAGGRVIKS